MTSGEKCHLREQEREKRAEGLNDIFEFRVHQKQIIVYERNIIILIELKSTICTTECDKYEQNIRTPFAQWPNQIHISYSRDNGI